MVGDHELISRNLAKTLDTMKKFNARRKFKGKVKGIILANKLAKAPVRGQACALSRSFVLFAARGGSQRRRRDRRSRGPADVAGDLTAASAVALRVVRRVRQRDLLLERKDAANVLGDGPLVTSSVLCLVHTPSRNALPFLRDREQPQTSSKSASSAEGVSCPPMAAKHNRFHWSSRSALRSSGMLHSPPFAFDGSSHVGSTSFRKSW